MNEKINRTIVAALVVALVLSLVVTSAIPAVLAWWDRTPYWLLLYTTYPVALISLAVVFGNVKPKKANEEKRKNSNEYC